MKRRTVDPSSQLVWQPVAGLRLFLERPPPADGYLTLSAVDAQRREAQLGRLLAGAEPAQPWLVRLVRARLDVAGESRFRLRRWGAGGTPDGSVSFVVSRPASGAAAPSDPAREGGPTARLAALEADAAASRARIARLEARLAAAERIIARIEPVVAASEQALLILGGVDDPDT